MGRARLGVGIHGGGPRQLAAGRPGHRPASVRRSVRRPVSQRPLPSVRGRRVRQRAPPCLAPGRLARRSAALRQLRPVKRRT
eukprot:15446122-Alexandrium_andersonii.AAC.1